jgi:hypothetical protein
MQLKREERVMGAAHDNVKAIGIGYIPSVCNETVITRVFVVQREHHGRVLAPDIVVPDYDVLAGRAPCRAVIGFAERL